MTQLNELRLIDCARKRLDLIDALCFFQGYIDKEVLPAWISFATDVIETSTTRREFVEGTSEVSWLCIA